MAVADDGSRIGSFGHLMCRRHGERRDRVRGLPKVTADFSLLASAINLARLETLGITNSRPMGSGANQPDHSHSSDADRPQQRR